ncbi:hypothetical protein Patl1_24923 [Pistacia atlantica]|uniref:Uncharacterized protein n=1 Tax=Pistacia atlantica TaxID=434234 RepID=A0ACC1AYN9_9ROSI|nr:hypothetical protein Patl1_24923 [Pistacia atlantica]
MNTGSVLHHSCFCDNRVCMVVPTAQDSQKFIHPPWLVVAIKEYKIESPRRIPWSTVDWLLQRV